MSESLLKKEEHDREYFTSHRVAEDDPILNAKEAAALLLMPEYQLLKKEASFIASKNALAAMANFFINVQEAGETGMGIMEIFRDELFRTQTTLRPDAAALLQTYCQLLPAATTAVDPLRVRLVAVLSELSLRMAPKHGGAYERLVLARITSRPTSLKDVTTMGDVKSKAELSLGREFLGLPVSPSGN